MVILLNSSHKFNFKLNSGSSTNMKAELLAQWCLCKIATIFGVVTLQVYGDSRVMIKWVKGEFKLRVIELQPWCHRIRKKLSFLTNIAFQHIHREQNLLADELSKPAFEGSFGELY